jgi:hypothetical protein
MVESAAKSLSVAGPFLKFGNCVEDEWTGSVLFLTKEADAPSMSLSVRDAFGQSSGSSQKVAPPTLLEKEGGWHFWRFDFSIALFPEQRAVDYEVQSSGVSKKATFFIQGQGKPFHMGYTSCNGISGSIPEDHYSREDPTYLWKDMLQVHEAFPIHVLIGGGDQVYSDPIWKLPLFAAWGNLNKHKKPKAKWTEEHRVAATDFYLNNYIRSFTMDVVSDAYASLPSYMIWDDHDIWDGYGSYSKSLQSSEFFAGLFSVARKFYLLFQLQTNDELAKKNERGEWIETEKGGFHTVKFMGPQIAVVGVDMRSNRTKKKILADSTYEMVKHEMMNLPSSVDHVIVLSGVPVVFPSIMMSESILFFMLALFKRSAILRRWGRSVGILDQFDQPEILDDLLDGWASSKHEKERNKFITMLQHCALDKKYRVSILSGDAHVGGVGEIYSAQRPRPSKAKDPLFMYQIISSAIMNSPPPSGVVSALTRTNFAKRIDQKTRSKVKKAFGSNHEPTEKLLAQRNWADISLAVQGFTGPLNPKDPYYGGLRFSLRSEAPPVTGTARKGYCEDVYDFITPRYPN